MYKSPDYVLFDRAIERHNYPSIDWLSRRINVCYAAKKLTDEEFMDLLFRVAMLGGE